MEPMLKEALELPFNQLMGAATSPNSPYYNDLKIAAQCVLKPMFVFCVSDRDKFSEIYIPKKDYNYLCELGLDRAFQLEHSIRLKDEGVFEPEYEKRRGLDHDVLSKEFMNNTDGREGLLIDEGLKELMKLSGNSLEDEMNDKNVYKMYL